MPRTPTTIQSLRRVFYDSFVARDLAEPLASFDRTADVGIVREFMVSRPLTVVGLREFGVMTGYIEQDHIDDRPLGQQLVDLSEATIVTTNTSLRDIVQRLNDNRFVLVSTLGQPVGVIVRADLEKPPMRMWLFGMITLFEMSITRIIDREYPNDAWNELVSEARLKKAQELQAERARRNQPVTLLDCLQLSDKGQLFGRSDELRTRHWNRSRREINKVVKEIESLRNNLAHSQPFIEENWDVIVRLSVTLDRLLEIPADFFSKDSLKPIGNSENSPTDE